MKIINIISMTNFSQKLITAVIANVHKNEYSYMLAHFD